MRSVPGPRSRDHRMELSGTGFRFAHRVGAPREFVVIRAGGHQEEIGRRKRDGQWTRSGRSSASIDPSVPRDPRSSKMAPSPGTSGSHSPRIAKWTSVDRWRLGTSIVRCRSANRAVHLPHRAEVVSEMRDAPDHPLQFDRRHLPGLVQRAEPAVAFLPE
jgi:hypothetical protein